MGDALVPEEITALLGVSPTTAQIKGEKIVSSKTGKERIAKSGMWRLRATPCEPEDIDDQIHEILSQMTDDLAVWQRIGKKYKMDLFCGLFMGCSNEGFSISPQSLAALGARGVEMGLDIYAGLYDEQETNNL